MTVKQKAVVLMLLTALLWSLAGVFIKVIEWDPLAITCARSFVAAITMYFFVRKQKIQWSWPMIGAALAYAAFTFCIILSTKLTTSANAVMMQYTAPIYVAFLSGIILKEKIRKADWICLAAVICGMCLFFVNQVGGSSTIGNIIAMGNGLSFAFISIFLRLQKDGHPEQSIFVGAIIAFVIGIPFTIGQGIPSPKSIAVIIIAGIVVSLGYMMFTAASKNLSAMQSVMLPVIDPILNPIWVFLIVGEMPGSLAIVGGAVVLAAITIRSLLLMKEGADSPPAVDAPNPENHIQQ